MILARVICIFRSLDSEDGEAVAQIVHHERATSRARIQQTFADRITHQLFHRIAHGPCAEFRMKAFAHEKRQNRFVQFERVAACLEKLNFPREKFLGNLQLMLVAQAMEHEFLVHARENFRAQGLLRPREDVAFDSAEPMFDVSQI